MKEYISGGLYEYLRNVKLTPEDKIEIQNSDINNMLNKAIDSCPKPRHLWRMTEDGIVKMTEIELLELKQWMDNNDFIDKYNRRNK
jgi:hypothetical protein